ncbi:MAG: 4Fe-4S dicluster domain-containing protein [Armatimonadetes bacterium]|nr:4Fe-4S dicluster domain-containing protein [Armatimonadota bacterium]
MAHKRAGAITINEAWCKRCDICIAFCPRDVLAAGDGGIPRVVDLQACTLCMLCVLRCPDFAVEVTEDKEVASGDVAAATHAG